VLKNTQWCQKKQESGVKIVRNLTTFLPIIAFFYNFDPGKRKKTRTAL
jgi:hypothetical protein